MVGGRKLTQEQARKWYLYDPETGHLTYRFNPGGKGSGGIVIGARAGWVDSDTGYRKISCEGLRYLEHRVIWVYMTGVWPKEQIDHRDIDRANNAWSNLRLANQPHNNANHPKRSDNTSGFKGVSWSKMGRGWWAQLKFEGTHYNLGYHATPAAAAHAYDAKATEMYGEFARTNFGENRA